MLDTITIDNDGDTIVTTRRIAPGYYLVAHWDELTGYHAWTVIRREDDMWAVGHTGVAGGIDSVEVDRDYCGGLNRTKADALADIALFVNNDYYVLDGWRVGRNRDEGTIEAVELVDLVLGVATS